jgi:hypothetical protein
MEISNGKIEREKMERSQRIHRYSTNSTAKQEFTIKYTEENTCNVD